MLPRFAPCLAALLVLFASSAAAQNAAPLSARQFGPNDALDVVNYSAVELSDDGRWLIATSASRRDGLGTDYRRDGDPSYIRPANARLWVIDTKSGQPTAVFGEPRNFRSPAWSPDAARLALLVVQGSAFEAVIWDRLTGKSRVLPLPPGQYIAESSDIRWTHDGTRVLVSLRSAAWKARITSRFDRMTKGPVFVQDSKEPFLAWDELRRLGNVRSVATIDVASGRVTELLPEAMIAQYTLSADDSILTYQADITRKTDYDVIFGSENRLSAKHVASGKTSDILATLKGITLQWADDGRTYAYGKDGRIYMTGLGKATRQLAGLDSARKEDPADTSAAAKEQHALERFTLVRVAPHGDAVLVSNKRGLWLIDARSGARDLVTEVGDSLSALPRYAATSWSNDGRYVYLSISERTQWDRGFVRYDRTNKRIEALIKDGRLYSGLRLSKDGAVAVYSSGDGNRPSDIYSATASLSNARRLTTANPQLASMGLARTQLLSYLDADGRTRYGVVYLPPNYIRNAKYPTLFNIYEDFFDDTFDATVNVLTANGYVVVKPSVGFEIGFPGEAWAKGVTAAANKLVEMGIADSAKLGVFGTSYGGYATNLLITQTNRFKAAVNISGKVDVVSFYTDSPRLGVRNTHAAEKSQDRLGATLWEQPQKYIAQSAIFFADRIKTPLMLMTGAQDSNVPADNTREMYYALRRLGKDVTWVDYMNSGHGTPGTNADEFVDFHTRLLGFFGKHLKGERDAKAVDVVPAATSRNARLISSDSAVIARGEAVFAQYCSSCHNFRQDGIGPHLGGLTAQTSADWIDRFVRDRQALVESGDQRTQRLLSTYKVQMPSFTSLTTDEMAGIIAYMNTQKAPGQHQPTMSAQALTNPIPDTIKPSNLVVRLQLVSQVPSSSRAGALPLTRITKLDFAPHTGRSYVLDLRGKLYELQGNTPAIFMDMARLNPRFIHEPGLATGFGSFAFHPDFARNGLLYTTHTEAPGSAIADYGYADSIKVTVQWVLMEWTAANPSAATFAGTSRELLRVNMVTGIHGVQEITFNPLSKPGAEDYGLLYVGVGDGGSVENGYQFLTHRTDKIWGTILRIDPLGRNSANGKYGIPPHNPFVEPGGGNALGELYAYGFRNPHRITWSTSGEMLAPNIGHQNIESVNRVMPGHDYGWPIREGTFALDTYGDLDKVYPLPANDTLYGVTYPVAQYDHDGAAAAVSGGFEYSGKAIPQLVGKYLFGDIPTGHLFYLDMAEVKSGRRAPIHGWTVSIDGTTKTLVELSGTDRVDLHFGRDHEGELYILTKPDGKIYKLVGATLTPATTQ